MSLTKTNNQTILQFKLEHLKQEIDQIIDHLNLYLRSNNYYQILYTLKQLKSKIQLLYIKLSIELLDHGLTLEKHMLYDDIQDLFISIILFLKNPEYYHNILYKYIDIPYFFN